MTAEEYLLDNLAEIFGYDSSQFEEVEKHLKNFAKLKCEKLLEIVAEKVKTKVISEYEIAVDKDSIVNAVDLDEFIK